MSSTQIQFDMLSVNCVDELRPIPYASNSALSVSQTIHHFMCLYYVFICMYLYKQTHEFRYVCIWLYSVVSNNITKHDNNKTKNKNI